MWIGVGGFGISRGIEMGDGTGGIVAVVASRGIALGMGDIPSDECGAAGVLEGAGGWSNKRELGIRILGDRGSGSKYLSCGGVRKASRALAIGNPLRAFVCEELNITTVDDLLSCKALVECIFQ
ncbi:hypothetical protein SARC_02157 [Sphaeroforma arctica JP610]|uniref:Uncharacterized protein n=1 Tax=Sphaeroforma arctica JP610 TaxID=667725 RepID=A0A0L0GBQ2_9EUKA|nr:hypothetical protein SARC_02157 [Sphaeroforma arctica JP610]KNC85673.1 hypothetical protein SARC_02157 [Sphaeroforma arctica JP610]|eukprot:XP_014159575.1 hypothetical protein SARC_02157 [Sphaeroforma arctica JP610]